MSTERRFVFDTNVIVSAMLFNASVPGRAFFGAVEHGEVFFSPELLAQLVGVLRREKFDCS